MLVISHYAQCEVFLSLFDGKLAALLFPTAQHFETEGDLGLTINVEEHLLSRLSADQVDI